MMFKAFFATAAVAMAVAMPASAMDAKIYPYHSKHNYCPDGLQPVSVGGVICCGKPNQSMTYAQMQRHPVAKRQTGHRAGGKRLVCPAGEKGCFYR